MPSTSRQLDNLVACAHCDLLLRRVEAPPRRKVSCPRCGFRLGRYIPNSLQKSLAFSIAGLLLYFPAMGLPLISLVQLGMHEQANVLETISGFFNNGYYTVALLTCFSAIIFPLCLLTLIFAVSITLLHGTPSALTRQLFTWYLRLEEWAMVEVYLLGILVTIFKMHGTTNIVYNPGFFFFLALVFLTFGISTAVDDELFWRLLGDRSPRPGTQNSPALQVGRQSAASAGLISCLTCGKMYLAKDLQQHSTPRCIRCNSRLHQRKPKSLSRTWALVATSALFFLPANLLPIMRIDYFGIPDYSTILDGILYFFDEGSYLIGLIILMASVLVPLFKIIGLSILLFSVYFNKEHFLREKTLMFRVISFIGRWSMLDIFVIALLSALVDFGVLTSIHMEPATTYFCIVVVTSICAAITFDPRILWDRCLRCSPTTRP